MFTLSVAGYYDFTNDVGKIFALMSDNTISIMNIGGTSTSNSAFASIGYICYILKYYVYYMDLISFVCLAELILIRHPSMQ